MNHINRLLQKARRAKNGNGKYVMGFIEYDPINKKFIASGSIWDGVAGSGGVSFCSEHDTQAEALVACETIAAQHPGSDNINFIMDDLTFPEGD